MAILIICVLYLWFSNCREDFNSRRHATQAADSCHHITKWHEGYWCRYSSEVQPIFLLAQMPQKYGQ